MDTLIDRSVPMNCVDCGAFSMIDTGGHELNKYNCEHCLVDDYMTGEI